MNFKLPVHDAGNLQALDPVTIISQRRSWREDGVYKFLSCQTAETIFDVRELNTLKWLTIVKLVFKYILDAAVISSHCKLT